MLNPTGNLPGSRRARRRSASLLGLALLALAALLAPRTTADNSRPPQPDWRVAGSTARAGLGWQAATAGDVNGDGFADVIVSAYRAANGHEHEGIVYLYYGSAAGLATSPAWSSESDRPWSMTGLSAGTAGDVNGDGFADLIVAGQGLTAVFHGGPDGPGDQPAWFRENALLASYSGGHTAAAAGDVNGDGYGDIVYAVRGAVHVYHGSATGLGQSAEWTATSNGSDNLGMNVSSAGDVNGDGFDDLLVGAHYDSSVAQNQGRAYVYHGSPTGLGNPLTPDWIGNGRQGSSFFGMPVSGAGDVNGDGFADILVGAFRQTRTLQSQGALYLYYGSAAGVSTDADWTLEGPVVGAYVGFAAAGAGDVNGDGFADIVTGTPTYPVGAARPGAAAVFFGGPGGPATAPDWLVLGAPAGGYFGRTVASAGDVDGDSRDDILIGAPEASPTLLGQGEALLYSGGAIGGAIGGARRGWPLPAFQPTADRTVTGGRPLPTARAAAGFTDVSAEANIGFPTTQTYGPIWLDLDGDGWLDVIYTNHGANPTFYRNDGDGTFTDVTSFIGIDLTTTRYGGERDRHGAACADYDNDGRVDLFITRGANRADALGIKIDELLHNDGTRLTMQLPETTLFDNTWGRGRAPSWVDYDRDGWIDLFIGNGESPSALFRNNGDGTFSEVTAAAGLSNTWTVNGQAWTDFDGDGWPDVVMGAPVTLYRNNGDGTFSAVTGSGLTAGGGLVGFSWGDSDGDGDADLLILTTSSIALWTNDGNGTTFTRVDQFNRGVHGAQWVDADNDGDLDVVLLLNGRIYLLDNVGGTLVNPATIGTYTPGLDHSDVAAGDYDNDGFADLAIAGSGHWLWRNDGNANHWVKIALVGSASNRLGLGARVVIADGTTTQVRDYLGDSGVQLSTGCGPLLVGVGSATTVDITVTWPSGVVQAVPGVAVDQLITIQEADAP